MSHSHLPFCIQDAISKKVEKKELSQYEIEWFVAGVVQEQVQECQIGAMLMAMFINGLSKDETFYLTKAIIHSGKTLKWDQFNDLLVDKHSTGGVGDKTSIILAPALAACGLKVPMISGKSLGLTGGTLDKLQSIPGFQIECSEDTLEKCLTDAGCFIAGAHDFLCPGDKILYKIRDATATVQSAELVQASIMSKKFAEGTNTLIVDIKIGKGGNFKTHKDATLLSKGLKKLSKKLNIDVRIVYTQMNTPIGNTVGNALEIKESIACMNGGSCSQAVKRLVTVLGGNLLEMKGKAGSAEEGALMINTVLHNGKALNHFYKMLICQGVSTNVAHELCYGSTEDVLPRASNELCFQTTKAGWIIEIDVVAISRICFNLGAGRKDYKDDIDYAVGIELLRTVGDAVHLGETWLKLHHNEDDIDPVISNEIDKAVVIDDSEPDVEDIIIDVYD